MSRRARAASWAIEAAALVDIEGDRLHLPGGLHDAMKFRLADVAPDLGRRDGRLFGDDAGRQLLGRHFEREKADHAAINGFPGAVGFGLVLVKTSDVEGDVGRKRGLAHAGTPGDNHKIGRLQAAHVAIEIGEARRDPRQASVTLESFCRHVDGGRQGIGKALKTALVAAGLGDRIELALGVLDLFARARVDRRVIGRVDDILADEDEIAAKSEIVDGAAIVLGVDDGGCFRRQAGEILRHGDAAEIVFAKKVFNVIGEASLPARINCEAMSKIRRCTSSENVPF